MSTIQTFNNAFIPAQGQYGKHARDIIPFLLANGQTLDPTSNIWCTAFVNACLTAVGYEIPDTDYPVSFLSWGFTVFDQLESGDILVGGYGTTAGQVNGRIGIATGDIRIDVNGQLQYRMIQGDLYGRVGYSWENWFSVTMRRPHPVPIVYVSNTAFAQTARATVPSKQSIQTKPIQSELLSAPRPMPMASRTVVPYDPNNKGQQSMLAGIAASESGGRPNMINIGTGGVDLSNNAKDSTGFPIWDGTGNSHAAGTYQFQPGTWKTYADQYGLNFQNASDQSAAAWYNAQYAYSGWASKNNAQYATLQEAIDHGAYDDVAHGINSQWGSSVSGNDANPGGVAGYMKAGKTNPDATGASGGGSGQGGTGTGSPGTGDGSSGGGGNDTGTSVSASPEPASTPGGKGQPDTAKTGDKWVYGAASVDTIVSRMPTHEPWKPHPKSNVPNPPTEKLTPANSGNSGGSSTSGTDSSTDQACSFGADNTTSISNTNYSAITSAANVVGVPLATMLAVSDLVSGFNANASNTAGGTTTTGLYQFSQATWDRMVQQYGHEYNISTDPTEITDPVSNATMGAQSINDATVQLIEMGISNPTIGQIYIMSYMGSDGGKKLIQAAQDTPDADATKMFPKNAANDPDLFDDTVAGVYNSLKKLGDSKGDAYDGQEGQPAPCDRTTAT